METRNVTITLEKAREWYNSGDASLKEIALQAFNKDELTCNFKNITTFKKACEVLGLEDMTRAAEAIATVSKASAAMFKLNIVRKALNLGYDLHLTSSDFHLYYPHNPFITKDSTYYEDEIFSCITEIIGTIKSEGEEYYVLNKNTFRGGYAGLSDFRSDIGVGYSYANPGLLGCANKEIARHFGKYFGMLITEAKYGDLVDFEIIYDKYHNYQ